MKKKMSGDTQKQTICDHMGIDFILNWTSPRTSEERNVKFWSFRDICARHLSIECVNRNIFKNLHNVQLLNCSLFISLNSNYLFEFVQLFATLACSFSHSFSHIFIKKMLFFWSVQMRTLPPIDAWDWKFPSPRSKNSKTDLIHSTALFHFR